jgi:hypothetical protein
MWDRACRERGSLTVVQHYTSSSGWFVKEGGKYLSLLFTLRHQGRQHSPIFEHEAGDTSNERRKP